MSAPIMVEIVETRSAGWAFRCHPCDITKANLDQAAAEHLRDTHRHIARPDPPPWRFDVPEVPEHVTCVEGKSGRLIVRVGTRWAAWDKRHGRPFETFASFDAFLAYAPFVEAPDPRKDTT